MPRLSCLWGSVEVDEYESIKLDAEIVHLTAAIAYDGSSSDRTTVGIGEHVNLSLDLSKLVDKDRIRPNSSSPWTIVNDSLGGIFWHIKSGPGYATGTSGSGSYYAWKQSVDSTSEVEAVIWDAGFPADDSDHLRKTVTFTNKKPSSLTFIAKYSPNSAWAAMTPGPPNNGIGGGLLRRYRISPTNVNFGTLTFNESLALTTWRWNDGTWTTFGGFMAPFFFDNQGYFTNPSYWDSHDSGYWPIARIAGASQNVNWPGTFGWNLESNGYYGGIEWIHKQEFASNGVATLIGNGDSEGGFGPWQ